MHDLAEGLRDGIPAKGGGRSSYRLRDACNTPPLRCQVDHLARALLTFLVFLFLLWERLDALVRSVELLLDPRVARVVRCRGDVAGQVVPVPKGELQDDVPLHRECLP
jgi:hypothetical protein